MARARAGTIAEWLTTTVSVALVVCAVGANQRWLDRHFLPSFLLARVWYVRIETAIRFALAGAGALLVSVVRPRLVKAIAAAPAGSLRIGVAALLAIGVSEPVLRHVHLQPAEWLVATEEPLRIADARLGWALVRSRVGHRSVGGRVVDYAIDADGERVRALGERVDPGRPTIVFAGESVMFGEGLTWDESVPARVGALLGVQSANLAVHGYASDQAYLHLEAELPRFRRPVAVVSLFMSALFGRNLDQARPHLQRGLVWAPPVDRWRLSALARLLVPYHSDRAVDDGIAITREVLRATVDVARAKGAEPLVVVPQIGPEAPSERDLRRRVFDGTGVPYVFVEIDPAWHLPWDRHPDARGADAIARAIAARLRSK